MAGTVCRLWRTIPGESLLYVLPEPDHPVEEPEFAEEYQGRTKERRPGIEQKHPPGDKEHANPANR